MKRRKLSIPGIVFILLFLSLACNLTNVNKPQNESENEIEEKTVPAESIQEQAQETVESILPEVSLDTAATLAALTGEFSLEDLKEIFSMVQVGADGTASLTVSDTQMNTAIQVSQAAADVADPDREKVINNPKVAFTNGTVILTGDIIMPPAELKVVTKPYVEDGKMKFEVEEATLGGMTVPNAIASAAELIIKESIGDVYNNLPDEITVQSVSVGEGTLTAVVAKK